MANQGGQHGNIRDKAESTGASVGAAAGRKVGETLEQGQGAMGKGKDTGAGAQETLSNVAQQARDVASNVAQRAQDAASAVGERVRDFGQQLRENVPGAGTVASQLEAGTRYFQQHNISDMADDLGSVVRQYPIPALLIAFGLGCFFGMASRR